MYKKIKNTITLLEKYGFKIQIDTILTKFNSDIKSILELFNYLKSASNLNGNLNCSKELEHYAS